MDGEAEDTGGGGVGGDELEAGGFGGGGEVPDEDAEVDIAGDIVIAAGFFFGAVAEERFCFEFGGGFGKLGGLLGGFTGLFEVSVGVEAAEDEVGDEAEGFFLVLGEVTRGVVEDAESA